MTDPAPYRLHMSVGYLLTRSARIQERRLEEGLRQVGLTRITWCILLAVHVEGLRRPSGIAEFIGIDRTATSRALRQMEAEGLVARTVGTGDRRTTSVEATAEGLARLDRARPHAEHNADCLARSLLRDLAENLADDLGDTLSPPRTSGQSHKPTTPPAPNDAEPDPALNDVETLRQMLTRLILSEDRPLQKF